MVHGIGKKGMPQFVPFNIFATGKNTLKTFSQIQPVDPSQPLPNLRGQSRYASLYINEITLKLLPLEDAVASIFLNYQFVIDKLADLSNADDITTLKWLLRYYETQLFMELGMAIDWHYDSEGNAIDANSSYRYIMEAGWMPVVRREDSSELAVIAGKHIAQVQTLDWQTLLSQLSQDDPVSNEIGLPTSKALQAVSTVHRQVIDHLFDYQPLQSRILWRQWQSYQF